MDAAISSIFGIPGFNNVCCKFAISGGNLLINIPANIPSGNGTSAAANCLPHSVNFSIVIDGCVLDKCVIANNVDKIFVI